MAGELAVEIQRLTMEVEEDRLLDDLEDVERLVLLRHVDGHDANRIVAQHRPP